MDGKIVLKWKKIYQRDWLKKPTYGVVQPNFFPIDFEQNRIKIWLFYIKKKSVFIRKVMLSVLYVVPQMVPVLFLYTKLIILRNWIDSKQKSKDFIYSRNRLGLVNTEFAISLDDDHFIAEKKPVSILKLILMLVYGCSCITNFFGIRCSSWNNSSKDKDVQGCRLWSYGR
jgi:hypothetical protein